MTEVTKTIEQMTAVASTTGKYKPIELPKAMTSLSDYRKTVRQ